MQNLMNGGGTCDRCGRDLPNTGVQNCVVCSGMTEDGQAITLHICTMTPNPCAGRVFTAKALAALVETAGGTPPWHTEEAAE